MAIKIVLPEGKGIKTGKGTKVFTDSGIEITGISHMTIEITPDEFITAKILVPVESIENLEGIAVLLPQIKRKRWLRLLLRIIRGPTADDWMRLRSV